jgi:aminoglycoside phosphotransferase family enzyme
MSSNTFALSSDGYYTATELKQIYNKQYSKKIPYEFGTGRITDVTIENDGSVIVNATIDEEYYKLPKLLRIELESKGLDRLEKNYCRQVIAKKAPIAKVREITGLLKNSKGDVERTIVYSPDMCEE